MVARPATNGASPNSNASLEERCHVKPQLPRTKRDGRSGRGLIVVTSFAFNETVST